MTVVRGVGQDRWPRAVVECPEDVFRMAPLGARASCPHGSDMRAGRLRSQERLLSVTPVRPRGMRASLLAARKLLPKQLRGGGDCGLELLAGAAGLSEGGLSPTPVDG